MSYLRSLFGGGLMSYLRSLFGGGLLSYLRSLCLFLYSGVQRMLCCVFVLFFLVLCTLCYQFL